MATGPGAEAATPRSLGAAVVVTVSSSAARGEAPDRSGPVLVDGLRALGLDVAPPVVVADGPPVAAALTAALASDPVLVLLTGGTGLAPDDVTPEQVAPFLDREVPGIGEALRADGVAAGVPTALLSRGVAGLAGRTLVVAVPGSTGACRDALRVLGPVLPHAVALVRGEAGGAAGLHGQRS